MRQNLGLQAQLADGFAVEATLLTGGGRGEFDVINAELIQGLGDLDLGLGVEEGVGELFAFTKGALDDLEVGDIAQKVLDGRVGVAGLGSRGLVGFDCSGA